MVSPVQEYHHWLDGRLKAWDRRKFRKPNPLHRLPCLTVDSTNTRACSFREGHGGPHSWAWETDDERYLG